MVSVADMAKEFVKRASAGTAKSVSVPKDDIALFLSQLILEGFRLSEIFLDSLDPDVKNTIMTLLQATAAGAVIGATVGQMVAGPPGVAVGASVGAGVGFIAGCIAISIQVHKEGKDHFRVAIA